MQGKKIKNTHEFSKVNKFIWNQFQMNKTFLIEINKYFKIIDDYRANLNGKHFENIYHWRSAPA